MLLCFTRVFLPQDTQVDECDGERVWGLFNDTLWANSPRGNSALTLIMETQKNTKNRQNKQTTF